MDLSQLDIAFFIPKSLKPLKRKLFDRIGSYYGKIIVGDIAALGRLPNEIVPMIGCTIELRPLIEQWRKTKRPFIYWDRGYWARQGRSAFPKPGGNGRYRVHFNAFQMREIRKVPADRYYMCPAPIRPWHNGGKHIVVALPSKAYAEFHGLPMWMEHTIRTLQKYTKRPIKIRDKTQTRSLQNDLFDAHALVTHGSIAAIEAAILGVPVFVDPSSAAALVGLTDLSQIETPIRPDRQAWLQSLAYSQFTDLELMNGTAIRLSECNHEGWTHGPTAVVRKTYPFQVFTQAR